MAVALTVSAQISYRTAELQRLSSVLSLDTSKLDDGYNFISVNEQPIVVVVSNHTVNHVGLHLFNTEMRQSGSSPIFDFLERYFLQLKYPPTVKTAQKMISDDQFRFVVGSLKSVDSILPSDAFAYDYDNRQYTASWSRNGKTFLSVCFPVEYELISGENKIEAENNLMADVKSTTVLNSNLVPAQDNYYINKYISNRLYYQKGKLVVSERHPAETVANMLLSFDIKGDFTVHVTQVSYGFKKTAFDMPLQQWITFCKNNRCHLYVGIEDINSDGDVSAVMIAVNEAENYNHVLTVTVPADIIKDQSGSFDARLYPYVPTHNVKSLFASFRKSNPKTISK